MAYFGAGGAAGAAAARRKRMMLAEEEGMARYTQDELNNDWEFKIVRSESAAFRKPEVLRKLIEEEVGVLFAGLGVFGLSLADDVGAATRLWTVAAALPLVLIALVVLGLLVLVVVRSR